jgi:hemolysin activation/secretion protein
MYSKVLKLSVAVMFLSATYLHAEILPDAGSILREQQPQRQLLPDRLPKPEKEKPVATFDENAERVLVNGFSFKGNEGVISEADLKALVADSIGKRLSFGELQATVEKITRRLKDNGWFLSRAYLPKQDITSGIILIQIEQGKSDGRIQFNRDKAARVRMSLLRSFGEQSVIPGQPLNEQGLERSVMLLNDLPGVNAKASLAQGSLPGTSRVDVTVTEGPLVSGTITGDNQGSRYTGIWRANASASVNDLTGYGDKLTLIGVDATGMKQGKILYGFPVFYDGLRGSVSYTAMHYKLYKLSPELQAFDYNGNSHGIEAGLAYPIVRGRDGSIISSVNYGYQELKDNLGDVTYSDKQSRYLSIGLNGDRYDSFFGGGYTTWSAGMTTGSTDYVVRLDPVIPHVGQYTRFNFAMARLQHILERTSLNVSWTCQLAAENLNSGEKISLGGPYGIRAYSLGEASGDQAQLINVDLRYSLPVTSLGGNLQISGFFDAGQVQVEKYRTTTDFGTATNRNVYWLQGYGAGLNYDFSGRFSIRTTWAHVIGNNPGRSITGNNSDGKNDRSRYWLQALMYF